MRERHGQLELELYYLASGVVPRLGSLWSSRTAGWGCSGRAGSLRSWAAEAG